MRLDEEMALACAADGVPRLRLYTWEPYTLSLGHHQDESRIDHALLGSRGYGLVRRPTGGRAVFHAEEITYAVAMPSGGAGVHETYGRISEAICRGLELAGAAGIEFSRTQPDFREHYTSDDSASCFSASALNELTWRGRKLVGSAQRRYGGVLLQHGSILLGPAHLEIIDLFGGGAMRDALRERLAARTVTLGEIMGGELPPVDAIAAALREGFAGIFGVNPVPVSDTTSTNTSLLIEPSA
jgi:lipoate-protein ligase A